MVRSILPPDHPPDLLFRMFVIGCKPGRQPHAHDLAPGAPVIDWTSTPARLIRYGIPAISKKGILFLKAIRKLAYLFRRPATVPRRPAYRFWITLPRDQDPFASNFM